MRILTLLIIGLTLVIVGCAKKEQAVPAETEVPAAESEAPAAAEETEAVEAAASEAIEDWRDSAFLDHMHAHAEQLDELNFALSDGDLDAAMTPAYWLSRHKTVDALPTELQPFVDGMRESASAVEAATDLATARAAAEQISLQCQGCHSAVGVDTE